MNGSNLLQLPDLNGVFVGQTLSGTGIAGGTTITAIGQGGQYNGVVSPNAGVVQLSANMNATGVNAVTFTATGFALVSLNAPNCVGLG